MSLYLRVARAIQSLETVGCYVRGRKGRQGRLERRSGGVGRIRTLGETGRLLGLGDWFGLDLFPCLFLLLHLVLSRKFVADKVVSYGFVDGRWTCDRIGRIHMWYGSTSFRCDVLP